MSPSLAHIPETIPAPAQRLVLTGITWPQYEALIALFIDQFPALRMTYLEGTLELMTTSLEHERLKKIFARLIEAFAEEYDLELNGYGSATFRSQAAARGLEPDECYYLGEVREFPDIALEVALSSGGIDKLQVYQGLGIAEVWIWADQHLTFYRLISATAGYEVIPTSQFLPQLDPALLTAFIDLPSQTQAVKAYRQALRARDN